MLFNNLGIMVKIFTFPFSWRENDFGTRKTWKLGNRQETVEDRRKNCIWILWRFVILVLLLAIFSYFIFMVCVDQL